MNQKSIVLIVDDQEAMRATLDGMLCKQGYELAFAVSGLEALELAAQLLPDLILLDVMMPGMNGFEVCERLRADPILAKVPVIMVTALTDQDLRLRGIKAGADEFISKPYNMLELQARVRNITDLNRYRRLITEQQKFKWMFENTDEAYVLLNNNNQITFANAKARLYLNLSTHAPTNESFMALVAKHYYQVHKSLNNPQPIDTNQLDLPRYIVHSSTETALPFWLRIDVMEMAIESTERYLVHLSNVTEAIIAKRQSWTFGGQINHKFRTPLIPILSGSEHLLNNHFDPESDQSQQFLEMIHTGAIRLHSQIEKILSYIDLSNRGKVTIESCTITALVEIVNNVKDLLNIDSLLH